MKTGKGYYIAKEQRLCCFCSDQKTETEIKFSFECSKYENLPKEILSIIKVFAFENRRKSIALFFKEGSLKAKNIFEKFLRIAFELRKQNLNL